MLILETLKQMSMRKACWFVRNCTFRLYYQWKWVCVYVSMCSYWAPNCSYYEKNEDNFVTWGYFGWSSQFTKPVWGLRLVFKVGVGIGLRSVSWSGSDDSLMMVWTRARGWVINYAYGGPRKERRTRMFVPVSSGFLSHSHDVQFSINSQKFEKRLTKRKNQVRQVAKIQVG